MAKKSLLAEVVDAVTSVAGAALGAAAAAGTGVVVEQTAAALNKGGEKLGSNTPKIQKAAADTVTKPIMLRKAKRAVATRKTKSANRKAAAKKAPPRKAKATKNKAKTRKTR